MSKFLNNIANSSSPAHVTMSSTTASSLPIASPNVLPPNPSDQVLLVLRFFQAMNALDEPGVLECFSDEQCESQVLPEETFKGMGKVTVLDKSGYQQEVKKLMEILKAPEVCQGV
jgi:hypothetical protein